MWISAVSAIVLALLSGGSVEREEEKRVALGLEPRRPTQLWLPFDPGFEGLIPVALYDDGSGIYRLVTNNAVHMIDRLLQGIDPKRTFFLAGMIEGVDHRTHLFLPDKLPNNLYDDAFVYLDSPRERLRVRGAFRIEKSGIEITDVLVRTFEDTSSIVKARIKAYALRAGWDNSSSLYEAETDNAEIDPHHLSIVQKALKTTSDQELVDLEDGIRKTNDHALAAWVNAYRQLRKALRENQKIQDEVDHWQTATPRELAQKIRPDLPEVKEALLSEEDHEYLVHSVRKELVEEARMRGWNAIKNIKDLAHHEKDTAYMLLTPGTNIHEDFSENSREAWRVEAPSDEDVLYVALIRRGDRWLYQVKNCPDVRESEGILDALVRSNRLASSEAFLASAGEPSWIFPGELSEELELVHLLTGWRPTGAEDIGLFIAIADETELLTPPVRAKYEKLLSAWKDRIHEGVMNRHGAP